MSHYGHGSFGTWLAAFTSWTGVPWTYAIKARWSRLLKAVQHQGNLSWREAAATLRAIKETDMPLPEAVHHYGGATKLVQDAIRNRHL